MEISFIKSAFHESHYPPPDKPEIAFAGRSNVGKSSLINVLVNRKKMARTSSTPGRTQALNFFLMNNRLYLVDLPGYGFARVPLEVKRSWGKMVEAYLRSRNNLKGVVIILDIRRDPNKGDMDLLHWLSEYGIKPIIVLTKADKLSRNKCSTRLKSISKDIGTTANEKPIVFSAKTKEGKEEIWRKIESII
jgi:GTP-binding protein